MTFKDLKFNKIDEDQLFRAKQTIGEYGIELSVIAGKGAYSYPREEMDSIEEYSSYEVAVISKDGDFITKLFYGGEDDVVGWVDEDEINDLIKAIESSIKRVDGELEIVMVEDVRGKEDKDWNKWVEIPWHM